MQQRPRRSQALGRLGALVAIALGGLVWTGTSDAITYPYTTRSIYEFSVSTTALYNQGKSAGLSGATGVVILDFGRPAYYNGAYGTIDFGGHFDSNTRILAAAEAYARGYYNNYVNGSAFLSIALGLNNSCSGSTPNPPECANPSKVPPSFYDAGFYWAQRVSDFENYII